jgi:cell division control protein 7
LKNRERTRGQTTTKKESPSIMDAFLKCKFLTDPRTNDTYELMDYIGEGTFSVVQRARLLKSGVESSGDANVGSLNSNTTTSSNSTTPTSIKLNSDLPNANTPSSSSSSKSSSAISPDDDSSSTSSSSSNSQTNISNETSTNDSATSKSVITKTTKSETYVALKRIYPNSSPDRILKELRHLHTMGGRHNVVKLLGGFRDQTSFTAIFPYFEHDDFKWYMPRMNTEMLRNYLRGLFKALKHVHKNGIIHRDIKPRNYLYSYERNEGMLIDFGLAQTREDWEPSLRRRGLRWDGSKLVSVVNSSSVAMNAASISGRGIKRSRSTSSRSSTASESQRRKLETAYHHQRVRQHHHQIHRGRSKTVKIKAERAGTPGFRAPEVLLMSLEQTPAIDIWSTGVILLSLLSARYPVFPGPPRGHAKINSDAHALAQLEALLGREALERAAKSCHKQILESPTDKIARAPPPSLKELCQRGRTVYFAGVLRPLDNSVHGNSNNNSNGSSSSRRSSSSAEMLASGNSSSSSKKATKLARRSTPPDDLIEQVSFPAEAYDLLERCLEVDPMLRISAKAALSHPFLCQQRK